MSKEKFSAIYNLEGLSDQEIETYKRKVSIYFGLDPDANLFDVIWMVDPDTGFKRRQIYARRGTTDILRDLNKISVLSMVQHDGPGYVSFTATGKNAEGRQEIAVGAHATANLQGEKLAAAVSTAETRAGRRLTLKFVGLGILDSSEVADNEDIKAPAPGLTLAGSPVVAPPMPVFAPVGSPIKTGIFGVSPQTAPAATLDDGAAQAAAEAAEVSRKAYEAWQAQTRAEAAQALKARPEKGFSGIDPVSAPVETAPVAESENAGPEPPKQKRTRRKKNTVDIASPGQESKPPQPPPAKMQGDIGVMPNQIFVEKPVTPVSVQVETVVPPQVNPAVAAVILQPLPQTTAETPTLAPQPAPVADFLGKPTKEQEESFRAQLREYSNIVLPNAGMVPSAGIGGPSAKLRAFAERWVNKSTQLMTVSEWQQFFQSLKDFTDRNGAKALVKYINDSLGV